MKFCDLNQEIYFCQKKNKLLEINSLSYYFSNEFSFGFFFLKKRKKEKEIAK